MVDIPKINLTNQNSFSGVGGRFQATNTLRQSGVGEAMRRALYAASQAANAYKEAKENSPEEKEYWIKQERLIDETFALNGKNNQTSPEAFKAQAVKDKEKLMKEIPDDKQEKFSLMYESKMNGYNHAVAVNRVNLDYNRQLETFISESDNLRTKAFNATLNGDSDGYAEALKNWQENEEYMYEHGFISIEKKINRLKDFTDGALIQQNLGKARKLFGNSEQLNSYLKNIDNSKSYSPEQKHSIKNSIVSDFNTWQATNRATGKEFSESADFGIKAYSMGIEPAGFDVDKTLERLKELGLNDKAQQLQNAYNLRQDMNSFSKLSLGQMSEELGNLRKNAKNEQDLARIKALETLSEQAAKDIDADPLAYAAAHGVVENDTISLTEPETISKRRQNGLVLQEKYGLDYTPVMTKTEIDGLSKTLKNANAETKTAIVGVLNENFGADADQIFQKISGENPELSVAAKIYQRNPQISQNIIAGMDISANEKQFAPNNDMALYNAFGKVDQALSNISSEDVAKVKAAIKANMAFKNKQNNLFTDGQAMNEDKLKYAEEAIEEVLGGKIARQSGNWWSGYSYVLLPENVSEDDWDDWKDGLTDKDVGDVYLEDKKVSAKTIKENGFFAYDDNGKYTVSLNGNYLRRANGEIAILEYRGR